MASAIDPATGQLVELDPTTGAPMTPDANLNADGTPKFRDTPASSAQSLSDLERARATANGQNFRAPGFIGNFDRTQLAGIAPVSAIQAPAAPRTALAQIGTDPRGGGADSHDGTSQDAPDQAGRGTIDPASLGLNGIDTSGLMGALGKAGVAGLTSGPVGALASLGFSALGSLFGSKTPANSVAVDDTTAVDPVTGATVDNSNQAAVDNNNNSTEANSMQGVGNSVSSGNTEGTSAAAGGPGDASGATDGPTGPGGGENGTGHDAGGGGGGGSDGGGGGGGGDACFTGDTAILMADGSSKQIRNVAIGDRVMAFAGLGPLEPREVVGKMEHARREVIDIGGAFVTPEHPFLMLDGTFEKAGNLGETDKIVTARGQPWIVRSAVPQEGRHTVFNIEVEGLHTYCAGGFRVHNSKALGGVVGGRRWIGPVRTSAYAMGGDVRPLVGPQRGAQPMARQNFASGGGPIQGAGTENSDSVPISASKGEFVVPAEVVKFFGPDFFDDLVETAVKKTGLPRGSDQNGNPPSAQAQASFAATQEGGEESPAHEAQESPEEEAREHMAGGGDMSQEPEASNPPHHQGRPLIAAGPTMAAPMAMGGAVDMEQMPDEEVAAHARALRMKGDVRGHQAAMQYLGRRVRGQAPRKMALGGQVRDVGDQVAKRGMDEIESQNYDALRRMPGDNRFDRSDAREYATNPRGRLTDDVTDSPAIGAGGNAPYAMGGEVPAIATGSTQSTVGRRPPSGFTASNTGQGSGLAGPQRISTPRFGGGGSQGGGIRVPSVRAVGGPGPQVRPVINAPGPSSVAMPKPPAVVGQGPAQSVAPIAMPKIALPKVAAPRMGATPRTALGMIGRGR